MPKLKCWERERRGEESSSKILFYHVKLGKFLKIEPTYIIGSYKAGPDGYRVSFGEKKLDAERTKKEAISFALKYMKNHDRC